MDDLRLDRLRGALLGTAVGDALGLPAEGLSAHAVARRFPSLNRYRLLGATGYVSDDTEQSVLLAAALAGEDDDERVVARFRRSLVGWFWRLPFGIGLSTLRACLKLSVGFRGGVRSAGNGAAMRAPVLGVALADLADRRRSLGRRIAELTHTHPAGVQGAAFTAEVAALCAQYDGPAPMPRDVRIRAITQAAALVEEGELRGAINEGLAQAMALEGTQQLGTTGWVVHSAGLCSWAFAAHEGFEAVRATIRAGGDTDTHAAIVGAWVGAAGGVGALPADLVERLQGGPFGREHLLSTAYAVAQGTIAPRFSAPVALARNLSLYPVVLGHGLWRVVRGVRFWIAP